MTYFHRRTSTIIGAKAFHDPVRDGKGWDHLAMVVKRKGLPCGPLGGARSQSGKKRLAGGAASEGRYGQLASNLRNWAVCSSGGTGRDVCARAGLGPGVFRLFERHLKSHNLQGYRIKPHGQLVLVSYMHCCTYTPSLSTSWSRTTLQGGLAPGIPNLQTSFPLRCLQRLSLPYIATRQCHWHDNRYTSGTSTPVLSY